MGVARRIIIVTVAVLAAVALIVIPLRADESRVRGWSVATAPKPVFTYDTLRPHLAEFENIALQNGGNRAAGEPGYLASVAYVQGLLDAAGFQTQRQPFRHFQYDTVNLIADWPGGDPDNVLMVGAHLDSVQAGPGINDNATGSSVVLALALEIARSGHRPTRHLRFAWWGAEEVGLRGSRHYVSSLEQSEKDRIKGYVNVDMIASRNGAHLVYDTDDSQHTGTGAGADGSGRMEDLFHEYYRSAGVTSVEVDVDRRSDHAPFFDAGIPVASILSGSNQKLNGTDQADPCYHQACDTLSNVNVPMLVHNANALAHVVWTLGSLSP